MKHLKDLAYFAVLSTITMTLGLGAFVLVVKIMQPVKVHTQADPLMLQEACITGYVGILKPITIDLVVDANVYCAEKYPK